MISIALCPRPHSCHVPRVPGYEPPISHRIMRVSRSRKRGWRLEILVDGLAMCFSHHPTKRQAESKAATMLEAYTEAHYESR